MKLKSNTTIHKFSKTLTCAIVFVLTFSLLIGCDDNNSRDMNYYILPSSSYTLITGYDEYNTITTTFTQSELNLKQYDKITINLSSEWLYSSKIYDISFDVTTNKTVELQLKVVVTNLKNGSYLNALDVKNKTYTIYKTFTANASTNEVISINDIVELAAAQTCVIIEVENTEVYTNDNLTINDFAFSINNLYVSGEHIYT